MVLYNYDRNSIKTDPLKSQRKHHLVAAHKNYHDMTEKWA